MKTGILKVLFFLGQVRELLENFFRVEPDRTAEAL